MKLPQLLLCTLCVLFIAFGASAQSTESSTIVKKIEKKQGKKRYRYINKKIKNEDIATLSQVLSMLSQNARMQMLNEIPDYQLSAILSEADGQLLFKMLTSLPNHRKASLTISLSGQEIKAIFDKLPQENKPALPMDLVMLLLDKLSVTNRDTVISSYPESFQKVELKGHYANLKREIDGKVYFDGIKVPKIDPRKYITIFEQKTPKDSIEAIWLLDTLSEFTFEKNRFITLPNQFSYADYPIQKYEIVDDETKLLVQFKLDSLANSIDFFGNISIAAWLNDRQIQVNPYSQIGKTQSKIGTNAKPTKEIAGNFIRMLSKASATHLYLKYFTYDYDGVMSGIKNLAKYKAETPKQIDELIVLIESDVADTGSRYTYERIQAFTIDIPIKYNPDWFNITSKLDMSNNSFVSKNEMIAALMAHKKLILSDTGKIDSVVVLNGFVPSLSKIYSEINVVKQYVDYFNESGIQTKEAFLDLIGMDNILYEDLTRRLLNNYSQLIPLDSLRKEIYSVEDFNKILSPLREVRNTLKELCDIRGSEIHGSLDFTGYQSDFLKKDNKSLADLSSYNQAQLQSNYRRPEFYQSFFDGAQMNNTQMQRNVYWDWYNSSTNEYNTKLTPLDTTEKWQYFYWYKFRDNTEKLKLELYDDDYMVDQLKAELAKRAGQMIYKRLIYATIDLDAADAQPGDMLKISLMWYDTDGTVTDSMPVELVTAKFRVENTGWHMHVSDAELFVYRINEDLLGNGYPLSPSRFKPTAGVSLLWSYSNDKRVQPTRPGVDHGKRFVRFLKWLEPSVGINVTFLDFRTDETFEFGAGPVLGFFNKQIFLTGGYNFRADKVYPFYFGIGLSFANIFLNTSGEIKRLNNQ